MAEVIFFIAAIGAVGGALGTVLLRNPFYSVLSLVFHLLSLAALFLLLRAEFVAAAQVIVYAGAVMVLYVFVVAYVGGQDESLSGPTGPGLRAVSLLFALVLFAELSIAVIGTGLSAIEGDGASVDSTVRHAGRDRRAVPHALPDRVRGRVAAAADRRGRRRHPGASPRRPGRRRRDLGVRPRRRP